MTAKILLKNLKELSLALSLLDAGSSGDEIMDSFSPKKSIRFFSPSILEMFSRLCGLNNCITWGLSQVSSIATTMMMLTMMMLTMIMLTVMMLAMMMW